MGNAKVAGMDRFHLPDWWWVPRTVHFHILLTYLNVVCLRHVGLPPSGFATVTFSNKDLQRRQCEKLPNPPFHYPLLSVSIAVTLEQSQTLLGSDSCEVGVTLTVNKEMTHHATRLQDAGPASA